MSKAAAAVQPESAQHQSVMAISQLDDDQRRALEDVMEGHNVLISGPAGTGKSFLLQSIVRELKAEGLNVAVTATTGIAAEPLEGTTLHRQLNCGVPKNIGDLGKMWKSRIVLRRLDAIIVDEVSMMSGEFLAHWLAQLLRVRRHCHGEPVLRPLQFIFSGDFLQLPPVVKMEKVSQPMCRTRRQVLLSTPVHNRGRCYEAAAWKDLRLRHHLLTKVHRQQDQEFVEHLHALRTGYPAPAPQHITWFERSCRGLSIPAGTPVSMLAPLNKDVDAMNLERFTALDTPVFKYGALDDYTEDDEFGAGMPSHQLRAACRRALEPEKFWDECRALPLLPLRLGTQVLQNANTVNVDKVLLANGSAGHVIDFVPLDMAMQQLSHRDDELSRQLSAYHSNDASTTPLPADSLAAASQETHVRSTGVFAGDSSDSGDDLEILEELSFTQALQRKQEEAIRTGSFLDLTSQPSQMPQADSPSSGVRKLRLSGSTSSALTGAPDVPNRSQSTGMGASADHISMPSGTRAAGSTFGEQDAASAAVTSCAIGSGSDVPVTGPAHTLQQSVQAAPSDGLQWAQGPDGGSTPRSGSRAASQPMTPARSGGSNRDSGGARTPAKRHISDIPTTRHKPRRRIPASDELDLTHGETPAERIEREQQRIRAIMIHTRHFAMQNGKNLQLPLVKFACVTQPQIVYPAKFGEKVKSVGEVWRVQIPLMWGWAVTIHKSQGMTLDAVKVSLEGCFKHGMVYTALSRARTPAGLAVSGLRGAIGRGGADRRALEFYQNPTGYTGGGIPPGGTLWPPDSDLQALQLRLQQHEELQNKVRAGCLPRNRLRMTPREFQCSGDLAALRQELWQVAYGDPTEGLGADDDSDEDGTCVAQGAADADDMASVVDDKSLVQLLPPPAAAPQQPTAVVKHEPCAVAPQMPAREATTAAGSRVQRSLFPVLCIAAADHAA